MLESKENNNRRIKRIRPIEKEAINKLKSLVKDRPIQTLKNKRNPKGTMAREDSSSVTVLIT